MKHIDKILLIVLVLVVLFMVMKMNKTMNLQTTLLIGMASKMGIVPPASHKKTQAAEDTGEPEDPANSEDEEYDAMIAEMTRISEKIKEDKKLTKKEKEYYQENYHEELVIENGWEPYQEEEDTSAPLSGAKGKGEPETKKKLKPEERENIFLTLIAQHAMPKTVKELANMFGSATDLVPSTGNTHETLKKLKVSKKINSYEMMAIRDGKKRKCVFYGLAEWFDSKNKLKAEFIKKVA